MSELSEALWKAGDDAGDSRHCGVVTVAVLAELDYSTSAKLLERHGRKKRQGTTFSIMENALAELGFSCVEERGHISKVKTVKRLATVLPCLNSYWISTSGHWLAAKKGIIHDWSENRALRIRNVWRVERR